MANEALRPDPRRSVVPGIEADELRQSEVDAFVDRNRDALNDSIRRSRTELAKGSRSHRTIQDIIADGLRRRGED